MFYIYPYKAGSESVRILKEGLAGKIIKLKNSRYRQKATDTVINWGASSMPSSITQTLNRPENVALASNKLKTFQTLAGAGVTTVPFTTDDDEAQRWLDGGHTVFARHKLDGHSGEGIEVVSPTTEPVLTPEQERLDGILNSTAQALSDRGFAFHSQVIEAMRMDIEPEGMRSTTTLPSAPLYTKKVENAGEYRVHVFDGEVILYQKKSRTVDEGGEVNEPTNEDSLVRNLASGWVYRTGNLRRLERVEELALDAISALGLDFGAVDIIKDTNGDVFVLEVNSAPGISNTETREAYINAFNSLF